MSGVIFTQKQLDGSKGVDTRDGTRSCDRVVIITSPNAHLKTRAHWVLGWIPPKPPKANGTFEGRRFYAFKVWQHKKGGGPGYKRYWGYAEFDGGKHFGWIDEANFDDKRNIPIPASKKSKALRDYGRYRDRIVKRMKIAWRYRLGWKVPKGTKVTATLNKQDEAWDRSQGINKRPVKVRLRVPLSQLTLRVESDAQQKFAARQAEYEQWKATHPGSDRKPPTPPAPRPYLQVCRNPWHGGTPPYKRVMDLDEQDLTDPELARFKDRPRKDAIMKDGKPVLLEEWLEPDEINEQAGVAEFTLAIRWGGVRNKQRWLLGKVSRSAGGWAFVNCPDFKDKAAFELNPDTVWGEKLSNNAPAPRARKGTEAYEQQAAAHDYVHHYKDRRIQVLKGAYLTKHGAP